MAKELVFYDVKSKRKFRSSNYKLKAKIVNGKKRIFAIAKAPSGIDAWRIT